MKSVLKLAKTVKNAKYILKFPTVASYHTTEALNDYAGDKDRPVFGRTTDPRSTRQNINSGFLQIKSSNGIYKFGELPVEERKKRIEMHLQLLIEKGIVMNMEINDEDWEELLYIQSLKGVTKHLEGMSRRNLDKIRKIEKQEEKREALDKKRELMDENGEKFITNYPGYHTIFGHRRDNRDLFVSRYISSYRLNAPRLVLDCQYENVYQPITDISSLFYQLLQIYGSNGRSYEPFLLQLCNLKPDGRYIKSYQRKFNEDRYFIESTSKSYLDLYPKKDLVYLSPNARREMRSYDPNKTYIIGMLIDKGSASDEHTLNTARKEGIQCERLPLDQFVKWEKGDKELCVSAVADILIKLKEGKNWHQAIVESIPKRHIHNQVETGQFYNRYTKKMFNNRR